MTKNSKGTMDTSADLAKAMTEFVTASMRQPEKFLAAYSRMLQGTLESFSDKSDAAPEAGDKRFKDPIWTSNPAYRILMQSYLTWSKGMNGWVDSLQMDERNKLRAKLVTSILTDSLAPTNVLAGNPSAMYKTHLF